jgi:hypothetical protein
VAKRVYAPFVGGFALTRENLRLRGDLGGNTRIVRDKLE